MGTGQESPTEGEIKEDISEKEEVESHTTQGAREGVSQYARRVSEAGSASCVQGPL